VDHLNTVITALVTLSGVALGGRLSRGWRDRLLERDEARQWREIRLRTHNEYIDAYRDCVAFICDSPERIRVVARPDRPDELLPVLGGPGMRLRQRLDAAASSARLVSRSPATLDAVDSLVRRIDRLAVEWAGQPRDAIPVGPYDAVTAALQDYTDKVREELGPR
jgi:hypothetical protein